MSDEILGQVALGYSAFIDRNRAVTATRLTVFPLKPDLVLDAAQLLQAVGSVWPPEGGRESNERDRFPMSDAVGWFVFRSPL